MEDGQANEGREREVAMSTPHEVPIRSSAPSQPSRTLDNSSASSNVPAHSLPSSHSVWTAAINQLQTQISLNTSMLDTHRRQLEQVDMTVRNLHQDMNNVVRAVNDMQAELRARPAHAEPTRHDDLDVLTGQVETISTKVNEVDNLKLQIDLLKNRMKRWEDQGASGLRPTTSSSHRDASMSEGPPPPPHPMHHPPHHHHPPPPPPHPHLPPMRMSPRESGHGAYPGPHPHPLAPPPMRESHSGSSYHSSPYPSDPSSATLQASTLSNFRPGESLPPPTTLPGWRPAESAHHPGGLPPPPAGPPRALAMEPEPSNSGWAAVNANQAAKRPYEEHRPSPYESPVTGSPKRPKLAPIMPRGAYSDESYVPTQSGNTESSFHPRSRATSDASQSHNIPTPSSASTPSYRFITSTTPGESQDSWHPGMERRMPMHHAHHHHHGHGHPHGPGHGRGRGRGGGGGGRPGRGHGRRGRGGGVTLPETQELGTPAWEKEEWTGSQVGPNGYYNPLQPYAPKDPVRGEIVRRSGGFAGGPSDREPEVPSTPGPGPEPSLDGNDLSTSGGKKTRTKPTRNADGVLIRKDGRPDMRSVSSANNLRKVHAKKEAERAEIDGRTPTSARTLAPATSLSDNEYGSQSDASATPAGEGDADGYERVPDSEGRDGDFAQRLFSRGVDGDGRGAAERYFPPQEQRDTSTLDAEVKMEEVVDAQSSTTRTEGAGASQMTDVVMREMSDAQAAEHEGREKGGDGDTRMTTAEEKAEEERQEGGGGQEQETAEQAAS